MARMVFERHHLKGAKEQGSHQLLGDMDLHHPQRCPENPILMIGGHFTLLRVLTCRVADSGLRSQPNDVFRELR